MFLGEPAPPSELVDRDDEVQLLVNDLSNPRLNYNHAVIGYRRIGKSSILKKAEFLLKEKGVAVVYFDVRRNLAEPETFLTTLQDVIFKEYMRQQSGIKKVASHVHRITERGAHKIAGILSTAKLEGIGVEFSADPSVELKITPKLDFGKGAPNYAEIFEAVFKTVPALAAKASSKFVVILDEFQELEKLRRYRGLGNMIERFRGVIQERGKRVSYVISGSRVHMLKGMIHNKNSPLFLHFKEVPIGPMKAQDAKELFKRYVEAKGTRSSKIDTAATEAYEVVGGHPLYLIALAEAWDGRMSMSQLFDRLLDAPTGALKLYAEYVISEDVSEAQGGPILLTIMRVLASKGPMSIGRLAKAIGKPANYLQQYVDELLKFDVILKDNRDYHLADKVIESYLRRFSLSA